MSDKDVRELVRIRFELRSLLGGGDAVEVVPALLDRMGSLAAQEGAGAAGLEPEMRRWRALFGLEAR